MRCFFLASRHRWTLRSLRRQFCGRWSPDHGSGVAGSPKFRPLSARAAGGWALTWILAFTGNPAATQAAPSNGLEEIPLATSTLSQHTDGEGRASAPLASGGFAGIWIAGSFGESFLQMQWLNADGKLMFETDGKTLA